MLCGSNASPFSIVLLLSHCGSKRHIFWEALYARHCFHFLHTYKLCAWKASVAEQTNKKTNKTSNTRRDVRVGFHVG